MKFLLLAVWWHLAVPTVNPQIRTEQLIEAFKTIKSSAASAQEKEDNKTAFNKIDRFFDLDKFISEPIAPHKHKLTAAQLKRYHTAFRQLIRVVAYTQANSFIQKADIQFQPTKISEHQAEVPLSAYIAKDDIKNNLTFIWQEKNQQWILVDIHFDGASLVKDYKNQFGRILEKEGAEGLVKKIENRLQKERALKHVAL